MRRTLSYLWWPLLFLASVAGCYAGVVSGHPILVFNIVYLTLALAIAVLERMMPHEAQWLENDGQIVPDLAHTVLNKGVAQVVVAALTVMGLAELAAPTGSEWWPTSWPLA